MHSSKMSCFDFLHVMCCSTAVSLWIGVIVCTMAPHPVAWLKVVGICAATLSSCVAVAICAISRSSVKECQSDKRTDVKDVHRGGINDAYCVVDDDTDQTVYEIVDEVAIFATDDVLRSRDLYTNQSQESAIIA